MNQDEFIIECERFKKEFNRPNIMIKSNSRMKRMIASIGLIPVKAGNTVVSFNVKINVSEKFIELANKWFLDQILRHELSHYICFGRHGEFDHGKNFQKICKEVGCIFDRNKLPENVQKIYLNNLGL